MERSLSASQMWMKLADTSRGRRNIIGKFYSVMSLFNSYGRMGLNMMRDTFEMVCRSLRELDLFL
jgi:hypothetical protein